MANVCSFVMDVEAPSRKDLDGFLSLFSGSSPMKSGTTGAIELDAVNRVSETRAKLCGSCRWSMAVSFGSQDDAEIEGDAAELSGYARVYPDGEDGFAIFERKKSGSGFSRKEISKGELMKSGEKIYALSIDAACRLFGAKAWAASEEDDISFAEFIEVGSDGIRSKEYCYSLEDFPECREAQKACDECGTEEAFERFEAAQHKAAGLALHMLPF